MRNRLFGWLGVVLLIWTPPVHAADHDAWLAKVEGFFSTDRAKTPFGEIPFALDMVKEADGSIYGRTWADGETYIDFKFYQNEIGELLFRETGALPGGLVQSHILEVAKADGDTITFESRKAPGLIVATVTADGRQLHVVSVVRGKLHADLQMPRVNLPLAFTTFRERNAVQAGLGQITGNYELSVTQRALAITFEGGKLFGLPSGGDKREITPESDGLFKFEGAPFKLRFVRDEKGAVNYFLMLVDGEEVQRGTKVK
jgi:hypothetical protein